MNQPSYIILEAHCVKLLRDSITSLMADGYAILGNSSLPQICRLGGCTLYVQAMMRIQ
ncbi:hypothetical protein [Spirosoma harenae]